jgi:hypothetical protein
MSVSAPSVRDLLESFRDLAGEFRSAAHTGDLEAMERILARRRSVLDRLSAARGDGSDRTAHAEIVESILALDREAEELLAGRRDEIGATLMEISEGRRGLTGYAAGRSSGGNRIDERG